MNKNIAIGTDIGGSHISCAAIDLVSGKIIRETLTERAVDNQAQASENNCCLGRSAFRRFSKSHF